MMIEYFVGLRMKSVMREHVTARLKFECRLYRRIRTVSLLEDIRKLKAVFIYNITVISNAKSFVKIYVC
jgi:hypothetical protein